MSNYNFNNPNARHSKEVSMFAPIMAFGAVVFLFLAIFILVELGFGEALKRYYLLPWIFGASLVVLSPIGYYLYKKQIDMFNPIVFASWHYVFPALVFGGVIIAFDWVDPYFMSFIEDPEYNLPLTLVYISIGFIGLIIGYALPFGQYIAEKIEFLLPKWQWDVSKVWLPGIMLLVFGIGINILGLIQGIMGFQRVTEVTIFDGFIYHLLILLSEGTVLLWFGIFGTKQRTGIYYIVLVGLILFVPLRMALLGSRSSLLLGVFPIALAFQYSGRKLKWQYGLLFGIILVVSVCLGVVYGTTSRSIKGSEARINAGDYVEQISATVDYISKQDTYQLLETNAQSLADRVENLSSVAVVVSNYEKLAPYEASYGLENNIVNDTYTSFIPRFMWKDKPNTSDPRAYSALYFDYGDNSFAISPFGDLLRNFGPIGVPVGMMILGIWLRVLYASLIDTPYPALWKKVAYFPLLTVISYEAFYATIFPSTIRTLVVLVISIFLTNLFFTKPR